MSHVDVQYLQRAFSLSSFIIPSGIISHERQFRFFPGRDFNFGGARRERQPRVPLGKISPLRVFNLKGIRRCWRHVPSAKIVFFDDCKIHYKEVARERENTSSCSACSGR